MRHPILILIGLMYGSYVAMKKFNEHSARKFDYVFFTTKSFVWVIAACGCLCGSVFIFQQKMAWADGVALLFFGSFMLIFLIRKNIKNTNLVYGVVATCVQIPLFLVLAPLIAVLSIMACFGFGALKSVLSVPTPVRIVNY